MYVQSLEGRDAMKEAVGYIRVSTIGQADDGVSLAGQKDKIAAWACLHDSHLLGVYEDAGVSGKAIGNRPGLKAALAKACKHHASLVVYSLSRLGRSTADILEIGKRLDKAKADLVSLTESIDTTTAAGKMVFRMLAVLSEFERDAVSERTRAAMHYKRTQGKRISRWIPFGHDLADDNETLIPNRKERNTMKMILQMRDDRFTLQGICDELEQRGRLAKSGKPVWYPSVVRGIIRRASQQGAQSDGKTIGKQAGKTREPQKALEGSAGRQPCGASRRNRGEDGESGISTVAGREETPSDAIEARRRYHDQTRSRARSSRSLWHDKEAEGQSQEHVDFFIEVKAA